jgi:hypothetical protein
MKVALVVLFVALVGCAVAEDAVETVTSGVIEVSPVAAAGCPMDVRSDTDTGSYHAWFAYVAELLRLTPELDA